MGEESEDDLRWPIQDIRYEKFPVCLYRDTDTIIFHISTGLTIDT